MLEANFEKVSTLTYFLPIDIEVLLRCGIGVEVLLFILWCVRG